MNVLILGLVLFFASHSFRAVPELREQIIEKTSPKGYKLIIAIVSAVSLYYIVVGFAAAPYMELYHPPFWTKHITMVLMLPVFPLIFAAYLNGHIKEKLKHPMLISIKIWAVAHLIANGDLRAVVVFVTFLLWAGLMMRAEKRMPAEPIRTNAPGTQFTVPKIWYDIVAIIIGLISYALFVFKAHTLWIGVPIV